MKYYFFVNPAAGKGKHLGVLVDKIRAAAEELNIHEKEYAVYKTEAPGDGEKKARALAEKLDAANGEKARFYACGGDGTANEILNGIYGFEGASMGIVPIGTGNDTVRNYPEAGDFLDMKSQLQGEEISMDVLQYKGIVDGEEKTRYCINMFNMGFDSSVVEMAMRLKDKPLISGSMAYYLSIFGTLVEKSGVNVRVLDGEELIKEGKLLLCTVSNGSFYGGGIKSSPQSLVDDGIFDINMVSDVSRRTLIKFLPIYQKGEHVDNPKMEKFLEVRKGTSVRLEPLDGEEFTMCVDGEICRTKGIDITMKTHGVKFIVPAK